MTVTATAPPDLTTYRAVHRALRQGAWTFAGAAPAIADADAHRRKAFARWWKGYAGEVLAHHQGEDDVFFPALVDRVPLAAELKARTDADHHRLDELMAAVGDEVAAVKAGWRAPRLVGLSHELATLMQAHLDMEDVEILPLFERHFTGEEYTALDDKVVKAVGVGPQAAFTVPFVVAAMGPEEARTTLATAPVPLRVLHALTRRSHARLVRRAFGTETTGAA